MPPAVVETHSAVVFFLGDRAYKVKKPVDLGFLDFSTRELREQACHREVTLNRRLAPDVYEGVADVIGPDGAPLDHLVVMRRMPDDRRLARLATEGADLRQEVWRLAHQIAAFHGRAERSPQADALASVEATRARWDANTNAMIADAGSILDGAQVALVHALACRYLDARQPLFDARVADGHALDGHGDLLADDVFLLPDGPRVLDCLDFDERLRLGDGLADVAFLAMDLESLGRRDLADAFLAAYAEHSGDVWPPSLAHHHIAYRAQVRAKVAALRAHQGAPDAVEEARHLLDLAAHHLETGRVRLVIVGGPPGAGKSTVASAVAEDLAGVLLRSDVARKELAGVPVTTSLVADVDQGAYEPAARGVVYETMLDRAEVALGMGETVVLDATWADADQRRRARHVGQRACADVVELCCWAPPHVCDQRIAARSTRHDPSGSDATPAIAGAVRAAFAPWPEAELLDTDQPVEATVEQAVAAVHLRRTVLEPA